MRLRKGWDESEVIAGKVKDGIRASTAAIQKSEEEREADGGVASGDAAGDGDSGGADCRRAGFHDEDGVSTGAVGTEADDQPWAA